MTQDTATTMPKDEVPSPRPMSTVTPNVPPLEGLPWVTLRCRGVDIILGRQLLMQPGGYEVSESGYHERAISDMFVQTFMFNLMRKFREIPELRDTVRSSEPLEWKSPMTMILWLRSVHDGVPYDTVGWYVGGWESLVPWNITSIELIPSESG